MPKMDNDPCPVEVPVDRARMTGCFTYGGAGSWMTEMRDFSVWLTSDALHLRKIEDSRDQGARKLNIMLRQASKK